MELLFNEIAEFNVLELFVRSVLSAFNPNAVATSDANTALGLKAGKTDLTNNYNTLNSAISLKSNSTDVYNKIDTYTKTEVNQQITNLIDGAPTTLNTLNEIALALGNDKNFQQRLQLL